MPLRPIHSHNLYVSCPLLPQHLQSLFRQSPNLSEEISLGGPQFVPSVFRQGQKQPICGGFRLRRPVDVRMSEYFELKDVESLNRLVPFKPLRKEASTGFVWQLAFQANVFACGAMALGASFCHKVADGATMSSFLSSCTALSCGSLDHVENPYLSAAAALFRPVEDFREQQRSMFEQLWFNKEGDYVTRRFMFDAESIENPNREDEE